MNFSSRLSIHYYKWYPLVFMWSFKGYFTWTRGIILYGTTSSIAKCFTLMVKLLYKSIVLFVSHSLQNYNTKFDEQVNELFPANWGQNLKAFVDPIISKVELIWISYLSFVSTLVSQTIGSDVSLDVKGAVFCLKLKVSWLGKPLCDDFFF